MTNTPHPALPTDYAPASLRRSRPGRGLSVVGPLLLGLSLAACGSVSTVPAPGATSAPGAAPSGPVNTYAGNPDVAKVGFKSDGRDLSWSAKDAPAGDSFKTLAINSGDNALSSQGWTSASNGWGPVELNKSNGESGAGDGRTLTLNGKTYSSGLGTNGSSQVVYAVNGLCSGFQSDIGVDDEVNSLGTVAFQVWADGTKLYDSGTMTGSSATRSVNVSLAGKNELKLIVTDAGDGSSYDHGDWAGALLTGCTAATLSTQSISPYSVPDTNYGVPWDAIVVSTSGSDSASGTLSSPFRTLKRAISAAYNRPGVTIVMRGGTYRESPGVISTRMTIQPYPHEQVWLKGSTVVSGWYQNGSTWVRDNWNSSLCQSCYPSGVVPSSNPAAGSPDMVFVDGQALRQVASRSSVTSGTFYLDTGYKQLVIGSNPSGHTLEATTSPQALSVVTNASGSVIRGIGFAQYGSYINSGGQMAMVSVSTPSVTFENTVFRNSASRGLSFSNSSGSTVRGSIFASNGLIGMNAWQANSLTLDGNTFAGNNTESFIRATGNGEGSGAKLTNSYNMTFRNNVFRDNTGPGLWVDVSSQHLLASNNVFRNNRDNGMNVELSNDAVIFSNVFAGNGQSGLFISNANGVYIYNNTFVKNAYNLNVIDDSRVNSNSTEYSKGITFITGDVHFVNNISSDILNTSNAQMMVRDYNSNPLKRADSMLVESNYNGYYRPSSTAEKYLIEWWRDVYGYNRFYLGLSDFRSATGREGNSKLFDNQSNPFFVNPDGDYHLKSGSPAWGAGTSLPSWIASRVGVSGSGMSMGAISWPQ